MFLLGLKRIAAKEIYPLVAERAHRVPIMLFESIICQRIVGMRASTLGQWDDAELHFAETRRIVDAFPNPFDEPNLELWHGKMLLDRGRPENRETAMPQDRRRARRVRPMRHAG